MFRNPSTTYAVKKLNDVTVSGPYPDKQYAIAEAYKWVALYKESVKVVNTKTGDIVLEC